MARNRLAKPGNRRILVVANEAVDGAALRDAIKLRASSRQGAEVHVIAPALNSRLRHWVSDEDEARRSAGLRLAASRESLSAAGIAAEGRVGDADPLQAISDALYEFSAEEIVIATHPQGCSHWLTRDLVGRARRRFPQPVVHIVVEPSEHGTSGSAATTRRRRNHRARGAAPAAVSKASLYRIGSLAGRGAGGSG